MSKNLMLIKLYAPYTTAVIYEKQNLSARTKFLKILLQKVTSEHKGIHSFTIGQLYRQIKGTT